MTELRQAPAVGHREALASPAPRRTGIDADGSSATARRGRGLAGPAAVVAGLTALYLAYVVHFSVNAIFWDGWTLVPLVNAALHGHLSLHMLWRQHVEERMLVANLVMVPLAAATHYDVVVMNVFSAGALVMGFLVFLRLFRAYLGRPLSAVMVLSVGVVWFSLADKGNALWSFQFAWYLVTLLLVVAVCLLLVPTAHRGLTFAVAALATVAASYSSVQGLLIWPVGLLCLLWTIPGDARPRRRRLQVEVPTWVAVAVVTTLGYFWHFNFRRTSAPGSGGFALRHPDLILGYFLAAAGNVIPADPHSPDVALHALIGVVVVAAAIVVVVRSFRRRERGAAEAMPVALIGFGLAFDLLIALTRAASGLQEALASRYTVANLLVVVAVVAYAWSVAGRPQETSSGLRRLGLGAVALFVVVQLAASTAYGLEQGHGNARDFTVDARVAVNLPRIPAAEQQCYVSRYVWNTLTELRPVLPVAKADRLSMFSPPLYRRYLAEGPPTRCSSPESVSLLKPGDT